MIGNLKLHGLVFNIMRYSVADGPGLRTTIFLKGCPLRCAWCHNPESQSTKPQHIFRNDRCLGCEDCLDACPQKAITLGKQGFNLDEANCIWCGECQAVCPSQAREIKGQTTTVEQVMTEIMKDLPFYEQSGGGVTFSGGEPLMQPEFLEKMLKVCKGQEIHTALDTSGCVKYEVIQRMTPYVDLFLYDLKTMNRQVHKELVGVDNQIILDNLARLIREGSQVMVRMPLIPGINDSPEDIHQAGEFLQGLACSPEVELLPYHATAKQKYRLLGMAPYTPPTKNHTTDQVYTLAGILRSYGLVVHIGGKDDEPACSQTS
jgi:pyruvate formate lyase activating enzyme